MIYHAAPEISLRSATPRLRGIRLYLGCLLATSAIVSAGVSAGSAHAQDQGAGKPMATGDQSDGDIIVTAQRRDERLVDVPISITALTKDMLLRSGVETTVDLVKLTPGLQLPVGGAYVQPTIRGVSSTGSDAGDSSNVAVYVDGVYLASQPSQTLDLPDVTRVEVLKGPQGTLYGQNAEGGAIIITTAQPSFTTTGRLSASYGNYNDVSLRGYVAAPLSDTIAFSLAGAYQNRDGFRHDLVYGGHDNGTRVALVRGKLLFKPSDNAEITLSGFYSRRGDTAYYAGQAYKGNSAGYAFFPTAPRATSPMQTATSGPPDTIFKVWGGSVTGKFDVGAGTLTSITAYTATKVIQSFDIDYSPANYAFVDVLKPQHDVTQEINFVSNKMGSVSFSAGIFYLSGNDGFQPALFSIYGGNVAPAAPGTAVFTLPTYSTLRKEIGAAYAEIDLDVTDKLTLTAGGRYSYERQVASSNQGAANPQETESQFSPATFKKFVPRVTARYKLGTAQNIYASVSKGFKSGLISVTGFLDPPVKPEDLTAYEIGFKGRVAPGLTINIAGFHYDYKNLQVASYDAPVYRYQNAASSRINGADFDLTWAVLPVLTLSLSGEYLDAKYRDYKNAQIYVPVAGGGNANANIDVSGQRMIRAPQFTGTASIDYHVETTAGRIGAFASVYYNDGYTFEVSGRVAQPSYATVDGELSFAPTGLNGVRFVVWTKNLTNKAVLQSLQQSLFADGVAYAAPRTFGGRVEWSF